MRVVRLLKVLGPLTCGLLLTMPAGPARGQSEAAGGIPGPLSLDPAKFNEAQARAKTNDVEAQLVLGGMYDEGLGVLRSLEDAANWWMKAADQGLATAQLVQKIMYADHPGSPASSGEGFKWWLATAEQTLATASNNAAVANAASTRADADRDHAKVAEQYRKAAEQGDVVALGELGWMYYSGRGVPQDKEKALQLWRKAGPEAGKANARAESAGRWQLIQQTGRDSARASLGLWVASNMRKLDTRWGGYLTGALVDVFPDGIRYIGEDGVVCSLLTIEDMSEETKKKFGLNQQQAEAYRREQERQRWEQSREFSVREGTGFFVSEDGYLLTCHHVVTGAKSIQVYVRQGRTLPATIVNEDLLNDVALLKVSGFFPCLPMISTESVRVLSDVLTVGFPMIDMQGREPKATPGHINSLSGAQDETSHFQIDVPIQHGNSGGPLVDLRGNVIGVVDKQAGDLYTLKKTGAVPHAIGYAVKSDYALALMPAEWRRKEPNRGEERKAVDVAEEVTRATVMIIAQ